ncbi:MAG: DEAD/DEAH box helicase [Bacteroidota bacterium]
MFKSYLGRLGISQLKPMQEAAVKAIRPGADIVLLSPTGSGKTLAFLLPLIKMLVPGQAGVQALILAPSRELALQIEQVFKQLQSGFKVNTCYGGHPVSTERNNLKEPPALLIGTPGRVADHIRRSSFDTSSVTTLVLDEFDKSLEFGFQGEMEFITSRLEMIASRVLTSATNLNTIPEFTGICNPEVLDFTVDATPQRLNLSAVKADGTDKLEALFHLICHIGNEACLVFCNHRETVERVSGLLSDKHIRHGIYHGGLEQEERELALIRFRNGTHHLLLTTDLASRGLDIPEIRHVIHYQFPATENAWTHRNGRTARMHASGTAWLVMAQNDFIPSFIRGELLFVDVSDAVSLPEEPLWETIYIGAGKKDKISRGDVAGFLMQKGHLPKDGLGKIEVLDYASFAAVKREICQKMLSLVQDEPIKKKSVKIDIARF